MSSSLHIEQCIAALSPYASIGIMAVAGIIFINILVTNCIYYYIGMKSKRKDSTDSESSDSYESADGEESTTDSGSYDEVINVGAEEDVDEESTSDSIGTNESNTNEEEDTTIVTPDNAVITLHADGNSTVVTPCGTTIAIEDQNGESAIATIITPDSKVFSNIQVDVNKNDDLNELIESLH